MHESRDRPKAAMGGNQPLTRLHTQSTVSLAMFGIARFAHFMRIKAWVSAAFRSGQVEALVGPPRARRASMSQAPPRHPSRTQILAGLYVRRYSASCTWRVKPIGLISATWLTVHIGWGRLPPGVSRAGLSLIGLLTGIVSPCRYLSRFSPSTMKLVGRGEVRRSVGFGNIGLPRFVLRPTTGQRHKSGP